MLKQCEELGIGAKCLPVYCELLILEPEKWIRYILKFMDLPSLNSIEANKEYHGVKKLID